MTDLNRFLMRLLTIATLLGSLLLSCGDAPSTYVELTVIDRASEQALDSSAVILYRSMPGQARVAQDTHWTDPEGRTAFALAPESGYRYQVRAERRHYRDALAPTGGRYENEALIELADSNRLVLALEPIAPPDPERFVKMHADIAVKEVIAAIVSDQWTWAFLPRLTWADIPALLTIGGDTSYLAPYPHHPRSTYQPDSVRAGLTALWLIEAIRRNRDDERPGALMPPSRAPVLGTRYGNPSGYNSPEQMARAHRAYQQWYQQYHDDPSQGRRHHPLWGKGLSWM